MTSCESRSSLQLNICSPLYSRDIQMTTVKGATSLIKTSGLGRGTVTDCRSVVNGSTITRYQRDEALKELHIYYIQAIRPCSYHVRRNTAVQCTDPQGGRRACALRVRVVALVDVRVLRRRVRLEQLAQAFVCITSKSERGVQRREREKALTDRVGVDVVKVLELPRRPSSRLVFPPLPLLVLQPHLSAAHSRARTPRTRTSILLFSLLAASKSPSRIPFATQRQSRRLSHSSWSSTSFVVTSSFGPVTSVNSAPVRTSLLVWCHVPSNVCFGVKVPGGDSPALNECDLPEK